MSERYVVHESDGSRDITFVATGPEVALAIEAAKLLQDRNINVTVVSMSCWNLFDQQPYNHRAETLGKGPQIAIEAAGPFD
ncbi:transketolase-like TK C-terminal-containing protein [Celeribacter baekdonensis]|uniref:Transketolase I protein n=1 Tax=Celeribacter baekdonensis B30 TaxID=1208323 RepID=K2JIX8_9RHOB|nr:transketolase C-terminal domain-containing protein [Celeribacter baekdonensis]EKE74427.1 transketolase I protein [Celeribacter baekdonensis B30]